MLYSERSLEISRKFFNDFQLVFIGDHRHIFCRGDNRRRQLIERIRDKRKKNPSEILTDGRLCGNPFPNQTSAKSLHISMLLAKKVGVSNCLFRKED